MGLDEVALSHSLVRHRKCIREWEGQNLAGHGLLRSYANEDKLRRAVSRHWICWISSGIGEIVGLGDSDHPPFLRKRKSALTTHNDDDDDDHSPVSFVDIDDKPNQFKFPIQLWFARSSSSSSPNSPGCASEQVERQVHHHSPSLQNYSRELWASLFLVVLVVVSVKIVFEAVNQLIALYLSTQQAQCSTDRRTTNPLVSLRTQRMANQKPTTGFSLSLHASFRDCHSLQKNTTPVYRHSMFHITIHTLFVSSTLLLTKAESSLWDLHILELQDHQ